MRVKIMWVALLCGFALWLPVAAQEEPVPKEPAPAETKPVASETKPTKTGIEDPPLHRWGGWTLSVAAWSPTLLGAEEEVALVDTGNGVAAIMQKSKARIKETVRISYHLPRDVGTIVAQYDAMNSDDFLNDFRPSQFVFVESRAYPLLQFRFADGVGSSAQRKTREFRLEYQSRAFETKRARGTWGVGYRQLSHTRSLGITYYAIVDPFVYPAPPPDIVNQGSGFSGHGLGASLDVEFPLHPRVSIVSGLSIGLVRGKATSNYSSVAIDPNDGSSLGIELNTSPRSTLAQSYDIYIGLQVTAYKGLKLFATLRDVSYTNVGEYVVPTVSPSFGGSPVTGTDRTALNVAYEGYSVGLSWRF